MEKKSCCCAGEAETVNVNMETTGVTGAEATANTVTAETETPSDDAVCHCRHKHRTEKEEKDLLTRLNRIEGQVRGIKAMVQDERYCPDILVQVSAVQSALNGFCKVLLSNHIKTCVVEDIKNGNEETAVAELCETIKKTAFKVTRVGQLVAQEASKRLNIPFGIIDLSLAPTPAIGDSVADILCEIGLEYAGAPGTTAALAMLNDQVKKGGVMASSYVGGLSGAFIPVSEDQGMIDSVQAGAITLEKLEAMTCVCSVGLDMIAIPGDTKATTISGMIADEMALGMVNQKTTAARLIPVIGKGVGDTVEFGGLFGYAPIMPVNKYSCDDFINRTGRIPAPIHSFKN